MSRRTNVAKVGVIGAVVTAVCCFTPALVVLLGVTGLSWLVGFLDYVLFPALAFFIGLVVYSWWHSRRPEDSECCHVDAAPLSPN